MLILSLDALVWVESRSMGKVLEWKPESRIKAPVVVSEWSGLRE